MSLYRQVRNTSNPRPSALNTGNEGNVVRISASEYSELASGSMTPTPSRGVRRRRDSNDLGLNLEDDNIIIARPAGTIPITPATKKRLKASCEDTARAFDIDPNQLATFVESSSVVHMLMHVEAHLLKIEKLFRKEQYEVLFKSPDFKSGLQDRLMVALLSPNIPAYVTDVSTRMMDVIKEQWQLFKVPKDIFEDPDYSSRLETFVSELLTSCRSAIKQKIEGSFKVDGNALHISILAQKVFPKGVPSTMEHYTRIAFLRSAYRDFVKFTGLKKTPGALVPLRECPGPTFDFRDNDADTLAEDGHDGDDDRTDNVGVHEEEDVDEPITKKVYTQHQYWNYVDDYLDLIRSDFAHITDRAERHAQMMQVFSRALQVDLHNFRDGGKRPPQGEQVLGWQKVIQRSACW